MLLQTQHLFKNLMNNEGIDFNIEDQHFRCFAHIMNLARRFKTNKYRYQTMP